MMIPKKILNDKKLPELFISAKFLSHKSKEKRKTTLWELSRGTENSFSITSSMNLKVSIFKVFN